MVVFTIVANEEILKYSKEQKMIMLAKEPEPTPKKQDEINEYSFNRKKNMTE
jgi:siroheme synthase